MTKSISPVPVFFRPEMAADAGSCSPSAGKPPLVMADWQAHGMPVTVRSFEAVNEATLAPAHDANYVRGILAVEVLWRERETTHGDWCGTACRVVACRLPFSKDPDDQMPRMQPR